MSRRPAKLEPWRKATLGRAFRRSRLRSTPATAATEERTRQRLLEAAGQIFAEKGFDRATGKEICQRAGANPAAVNYHFGSMDGLYAAVVWEAHDRFLPFQLVSATAAGKTKPKAKLEAILELLAKILTGPTSSSWALRVLAREMISPSAVLEELRKKEFIPKTRLLRSIVGDLMGLPSGHPAVARGCVSIMGPCFMLLILDRTTLKRGFPALGLAPHDAKRLHRHLVDFALAGLSAAAKSARKRKK